MKTTRKNRLSKDSKTRYSDVKSGQQTATPSGKKGCAKNSENKLRSNEKLLLQQYERSAGPGKKWQLDNAKKSPVEGCNLYTVSQY